MSILMGVEVKADVLLMGITKTIQSPDALPL